MNNRKAGIEARLAAISIRTKQCFDFEIRNENYFNVSSVKAERNELYLEAIELEDELAGLPIEANPNRFIKSSFTLSLLWVAKFYRALCRQAKTSINDRFVRSLGLQLGINSDDDDRYQYAGLYLHHSSKRCENLLAFMLTGIPSSYDAMHFGFNRTATFINC